MGLLILKQLYSKRQSKHTLGPSGIITLKSSVLIEESMMIKRTPDQWHTLFAAQQASGLNQAQFCQREGLCPKHFSLRRKQLLSASANTNAPDVFIKAQPPITPALARYHYITKVSSFVFNRRIPRLSQHW